MTSILPDATGLGSASLDPPKPKQGATHSNDSSEFAVIVDGFLYRDQERQEFAAPPLESHELGDSLRIITTTNRPSDPTDLQAFARGQGLGEQALRRLFGDLYEALPHDAELKLLPPESTAYAPWPIGTDHNLTSPQAPHPQVRANQDVGRGPAAVTDPASSMEVDAGTPTPMSTTDWAASRALVGIAPEIAEARPTDAEHALRLAESHRSIPTGLTSTNTPDLAFPPRPDRFATTYASEAKAVEALSGQPPNLQTTHNQTPRAHPSPTSIATGPYLGNPDSEHAQAAFPSTSSQSHLIDPAVATPHQGVDHDEGGATPVVDTHLDLMGAPLGRKPAEAAMPPQHDATLITTHGTKGPKDLPIASAYAITPPMAVSETSLPAMTSAPAQERAPSTNDQAGMGPETISLPTATRAQDLSIPSPRANLTGQSTREAGMSEMADRLNQALGEQLISNIRRGQWQLRLMLNPARLGQIDVHLRSHHGDLDAVLIATSGLTRDLLTEGLSRLKETLASSGIEVASLQVDLGGREKRDGNLTPQTPLPDDARASTDNNPMPQSITLELSSVPRSPGRWDVLA
jgi:flagellar hook-length control protein FliK